MQELIEFYNVVSYAFYGELNKVEKIQEKYMDLFTKSVLQPLREKVRERSLTISADCFDNKMRFLGNRLDILKRDMNFNLYYQTNGVACIITIKGEKRFLFQGLIFRLSEIKNLFPNPLLLASAPEQPADNQQITNDQPTKTAETLARTDTPDKKQPTDNKQVTNEQQTEIKNNQNSDLITESALIEALKSENERLKAEIAALKNNPPAVAETGYILPNGYTTEFLDVIFEAALKESFDGKTKKQIEYNLTETARKKKVLSPDKVSERIIPYMATICRPAMKKSGGYPKK